MGTLCCQPDDSCSTNTARYIRNRRKKDTSRIRLDVKTGAGDGSTDDDYFVGTGNIKQNRSARTSEKTKCRNFGKSIMILGSTTQRPFVLDGTSFTLIAPRKVTMVFISTLSV